MTMTGTGAQTMMNATKGTPLDADDLAMIDTVVSAIRQGRVTLAFQPVMQARDRGKVAFHEGLARITDAAGNLLPAGAFMGAIEHTELGRDLDTLALLHGLRVLHRNPSLRLSINMSARSVDHPDWNDTLAAWLDRNDTIAERLILEITESSAIQNPQEVTRFMARWKRRGVCFAMDDFGAGYTALRFFKDFRFDIIKINGAFVEGIARCPDNRAVTAALVSIARHFDMLTVAERVETEEDAQALLALGVDCLQGYHFATPRLRPEWLRPRRLAQAV
jgi:EAL domain-containing protein (putative c-di-GMP-specific phosphodiesterase class I)